jgi:hypothetical protein
MVVHWVRDLQSVLYKDIIRRKKLTPFLVAVSFIGAFALARLTVLLGPEWLRLIVRQYHIHHFYYGFVLIAVSNWIALTTDRRHMFQFAAVLFGAGLGLFVDEFGLLLTCTTPAFECDYYARQTYDAFMLITAALVAVLYSKPIISVFRRLIRRLTLFWLKN